LSERRKKTVLKTIRITKDQESVLVKDAADKRMTVNALLSAMIEKYVEWDRYTEKFELIPMSRRFLIPILETTDESRLMDVAEEFGVRAAKEIIPFWFKKLDIESLLGLLSVYSKYGGFSRYELETDGRNYMIVVDHGLGEKWSRFVERWIRRAMSQIGISPKIEISGSSVIIRFSRS
jgi:hypothetical protein